MRHALVIARRELEEKRFVLLAAAGFAVLPFLLAMIPALSSRVGPRDVIVTVAGVLDVGFTLAIALALGANVIGRDLAESRLSFYFSRPIGAASIWFGKVAAALALIAVSFAIIVVPARLVGDDPWRHAWSGKGNLFALGVMALAVILFFVAHIIGSFVRSRSAILAVDFAALAAAGALVYLILRPLIAATAVEAAKRVAIVIGFGVGLALIFAGVWQLGHGRTDRRRNHIALSQALWTTIGATLLLAGGFVTWMLSAAPSDLRLICPPLVGRGGWMVVIGQARGRMDYQPAFVYNADSGAYSRFSPRLINQMFFTRDGSSLLMSQRDFILESGIRIDPRTRTAEILRRPLERDRVQSTGLTLPFYSIFTATDDGSRIAGASGDGTVTVYDVPRKRSLVSARLPQTAGHITALYFASPALVRILTVDNGPPQAKPIPRTLRLYELDVVRRGLRQTGELTRVAKALLVGANEDGSRLLVRDLLDTLYVVDGRTAAVQASIVAPHIRGVTPLHNGGVALVREDGNRVILEIRDAAGGLVRSYDLPVANAWSLQETRDGRLITIVQMTNKPQTGAGLTLIIDPASGKIAQRIPAIAVDSGSGWAWFGPDPRRGPVELPHLFFSGKLAGKLFRWNYTTQKAEVVLPKS